MKTAYIMNEDDKRVEEEEWQQFKKAGYASLPIWHRSPDPAKNKLGLSFEESEWSSDFLTANVEGTEYRSAPLPDEWRAHGVEAVWVTFEDHKSLIHVLMAGKNKPLICTKHYN